MPFALQLNRPAGRCCERPLRHRLARPMPGLPARHKRVPSSSTARSKCPGKAAKEAGKARTGTKPYADCSADEKGSNPRQQRHRFPHQYAGDGFGKQRQAAEDYQHKQGGTMTQPYRCPECRTRRASFKSLIDHVAKTRHALCRCGGYHYSHRPGSPYCETNPLSAILMADRYGATEGDLLRVAEHLKTESAACAEKVDALLAHLGITPPPQQPCRKRAALIINRSSHDTRSIRCSIP